MKRIPQVYRSAFTLLELLTVMAVILIMLAVLAPAFSMNGRSKALNADGARVTDLSNLARQNAMAKNRLTAIVVNTDTSHEERFRSIALFELQMPADGTPAVSGDWKQISRWETLNPGIVVDGLDWSSPHAYSFTFNSSDDAASTPGTALPVFPAIKCTGRELGSFRYAIFLPNGSLLSGSSAQIRLVEGFLPGQGQAVAYTHPDGSGRAADYYDIVILSATGRTKVNRP